MADSLPPRSPGIPPLDDPSVTEPAPAVDARRPDTVGDAGRRRFFRQFAGELFNSAATVVGAAQALQRASAEAAGAILDPDGSTRSTAVVAPAGPTGFRTPFRETPGVVHLIDQRRLPDTLAEVDCKSAAEVAAAIREMAVRGAPAIGQVAAIGLALTAGKCRALKPYARRATLRGAANGLSNARPTATNLRWAVGRLMATYVAIGELSEDGDAIADAMRAEADAIVFEATEDHGRLATFGLAALEFPADRPLNILTHCNTGPLACGQFGTALGVVQAAHAADRPIHVWVDETRPYLQGARLTAWELAQAEVPHTLIADVAAGHLMARGEVDVVIVGADRIAADGDTANKIGTYPLAVLAARHGIPFYIAAPISTVDLETPDGAAIPIEERRASEVLQVRDQRIAPPDTIVRNPAFDVTPADLITGIVTDEGVIRAPYAEGLVQAVARRELRRAATPPVRPAGGLLMATVAVGRRSAAVARPTLDRELLDGFLASDRLYAAYAICDLEDREFARTRWGAAYEGDLLIAVGLEYTGPTPQPMFVMGRPDGIGAILRDVIRPRAAYIAAQAPMLPAIEAHYRVDPGPEMVRMWVDRARFRPYPASVERLLPTDIGELNKLYQLGFASWLPSSAIGDGVYYGMRVHGRLVAAAGTHVVSPSARLAVVGNVLTQVDYRGRGFATALTGAVTAELLRTCDQVVLNVRADNPAAINAYRRLGYAEHARFEERLIHRLGSPWPDIQASLRRLFQRKESDRR